MKSQHLDYEGIGFRLGRTVGSINQKFCYERYRPERERFSEKLILQRQEKIEQKPKPKADPFKLAMLNAIKSGAEKAVIGVFKDRRPLVGAKFYAELGFSAVGSVAQACADCVDPSSESSSFI